MQTILVIEDEVQTREIFLRCLKFEKFNGIGAENGSTGVRLATTHQPDLVVCDIMMPDMNGYEVLSSRSEERRVGKEFRSRLSPYH